MHEVSEGQSIASNVPALVSKLARRSALSPSDQQALLAATSTPRHAVKGDYLIREDWETTSLVILCRGMARAVRSLPDGSQQIVALFVAGDMLNPGELFFPRSRTSISALTSAISLSIPFEQLGRLIASRPAIARAIWRETAAQAAVQQEWMVWLGRRTAQARLAHFLCEISYRLHIVGHDCDAFDLPLTQQELADILGLSVVHVNRVLQVLRSQDLIELRSNRLTIRDKTGLYEIAEFDPKYLSGLEPPDTGATECPGSFSI